MATHIQTITTATTAAYTLTCWECGRPLLLRQAARTLRAWRARICPHCEP